MRAARSWTGQPPVLLLPPGFRQATDISEVAALSDHHTAKAREASGNGFLDANLPGRRMLGRMGALSFESMLRGRLIEVGREGVGESTDQVELTLSDLPLARGKFA